MCRRDLPAGVVVCPHCQRALNVGPWAIGFVLLWLVLAGSAALSYWQTSQLVSSQELIDHTHRVLAGLQAILGALTEAETAQRGFIITGDQSHLEQYRAAATNLPRAIQTVRTLTADNAAQQTRLAGVERAARARLEIIDRSVAERQRPDGFDRSRAIVASGAGTQHMSAVRAQIAEMQRIEDGLLEGRETLASRRFQLAVVSNLTSTAVAAVMVGLVFMLVRRVLLVRQRSAMVVANERERYRITLSSIGDAVIVTNSQGQVTFLNPVAEELTGWDTDAVGRPLTDVFRIVNERSRQTVESPVTKVLNEGVIVGLANHTLLIRRDGSEVAIDDSGAPIRDRSGAMTGVVLVFRDIADRRRAERALQESEDRYRTLIEVSPQSVWMASPDGRITFVNQWWSDLTGVTGEASLGDGWLQAVSAEHRDATAQAWRAAIAGGDRCDIEVPLRRSADDTVRWHQIQGRAIKGPDGATARWTGVAIDVQDERVAREALVGSLQRERETGTRLQHVAAASLTINASQSLASIAGVLAGEARTIIPCHQAYGSIVVNDDWEHALTASTFSNKHAGLRDRDIRPARVNPDVWRRRVPIRLTEAERAGESAWWTPDTESARPSLRGWLAVPLIGRDGRILGAIQLSDRVSGDFSEDDEAILRQLANLAAIAIENSRLYDALRDADRRKDEFLAMLSHELRNPLAPIRNALHIIRFRARGDAVLEQTSDMMVRQVDHMVRLVDDLLDVSRITRGKIVLQREVVDASTIVNRAVEASRPAIESSRHSLTVTFANQPLPVDVDLTRMVQVVTNLLNNAAKFTPESGRIEISTARKNGDAAIEVRDNGAGISDDVLPMIFDLFVQSGRTLDGSQGGLGIGLTLVKRLTEMHGGSVAATSNGPGSGSVFTVRVPLAAPGASMEDAQMTLDAGAQASSARRLRVLVVDDNRDSADSLRMLLSAFGNEAQTAYDGHRALELASEWRPELIVLDIGLPSMSGYDVVKRLRTIPETAGAVIVALTGYGSESDRHRSAEAGFDDHLVKPVDMKRLEELLARTRRALGDRENSDQ
jgi:PAS domain S-box-containing protein